MNSTQKNQKQNQPTEPRSNVAKVGHYDPDKYELVSPTPTVITDEALTPSRPPCLTQRAVALYLKPLTFALDEQPPRPTVDELPEAVIDTMVKKDKAFWVDKPGSNAYVLHDAYYRYGMTTDQVQPHHQEVFPRSYQYDLACVKHRRSHACDEVQGSKNKTALYCRNCCRLNIPPVPTQEYVQKRWRYYPDLTAKMSNKEIKELMSEVGRPFRSEACNWYNDNYPSVKYKSYMRKFTK
ncbi:hypothetical protein NE865_15424 [Phthorimaea operculella]|nr:hypothetical protein NE865_15424 [Phthorimaea operculella]